MTWFRSSIRAVTRLALFALAFQMAVSFGHMDADELGLSPLAGVGRTHLALKAVRAALAPVRHDRAPAAPEGYCPICASIALVASAVPSTPPALPVPPRIRPVWPAQRAAPGITLEFAAAFQARAPPAAKTGRIEPEV
ncbi:MAG TPA: hypothetical protein VMC05_00905 [Xanthobacteraceae bacterium]|nr:hypothetical protein [Xanthobacteraceae bacterium]